MTTRRKPKKTVRINAHDRFETAIRSGPVKTWANMTPEERKQVMESLKVKR